ncbi:MAG: hydrolase, partial [Clostridiales bacterium]|nr:hydrolase [Clostridiales bacterium]
MGKFDGVLLLSDFDNTLVYTEPALVAGEPLLSLTAENREALESFTAQGGHFAVATGRALAAFQAIAPGLPINTPCVLCNGAALYDFT